MSHIAKYTINIYMYSPKDKLEMIVVYSEGDREKK